jgi:nucleoside-diphosphate-sugar epimerase
VVHLAAQVHQLQASAQVTDGFYRVNVGGSLFVAQQAALANVRRFIFLSSIKVNGEGVNGRVYTAEDAPNPVDAYGQSKLKAELALRGFCADNAIELATIRPPLVYGPGVRANFERLLKLAACGLPLPLRSIDNRRSLVSVWNLVDFIETTMAHPDALGTWLVSDGEDLSTADLVSRITRLMHKQPRLFSLPATWLKRIAGILGRGPEASRLCDSLQVDISPARVRLNWQAPMGVDEGLARTVEAFRMMRA